MVDNDDNDCNDYSECDDYINVDFNEERRPHAANKYDYKFSNVYESNWYQKYFVLTFESAIIIYHQETGLASSDVCFVCP